MISASWAASSASSSSWRSSERGSRSPTRGSASSRSSPSRAVLPRERAVVEAEQADDAVGHRAHRHQRADRQVPAAEVGAGRPSREAVGEQRPDLGERQLPRLRRPPSEMLAEQPVELAPLPGVAVGGRGQRVDSSLQLLRPGARQCAAARARRARRRGGRPARRSVQPVRSRRCRPRRVAGSRPNRRRSASPRATPSSSRRRPGLPGAGLEHVEFEVAAVGSHRGPSGCPPRRPRTGSGRGRRRRAGSGA